MTWIPEPAFAPGVGAAIKIELADIGRGVARALGAVAVRAPIDLGGLDARLVRLSAATGRLPPAERPAVADALAKLLASFEWLERAIDEARLHAEFEAAA